MANSEDIEGRLCAYIEGDLNPAERAEIERHLEAHPHHREMIADLIRTRDLVSALPHVKAPVDLSEGLQGHLERSMLLGDYASAADSTLPWPHRRASHMATLAMVMLLAVGLASVVYYMLHAAAHPVSVEPQMAQVTAPPPPAPDASLPPPQPSLAIAPLIAATQPLIMAQEPIAPITLPVDLAAQPTTLPSIPLSEVLAIQPTTQPITVADTQPAVAATTAADPTTQPAAPATQPVAQSIEDDAQPAALTISPPIPPASPTTTPVADEAPEK